MLRIRQMKVFLFALLSSIYFSAEANDIGNELITRESREIHMAEHAILMSLMLSRNPASKYLCTENEYACLGVNQAELGLALIASKNSKLSIEKLAGLLRYRMDAGLAEDFQCYALMKGGKIESYLQSLNNVAMKQTCLEEFQTVLVKNKGQFDKLEAQQICSDIESIQKQSEELLSSIKHGSKCNSEDF